MGDYKSSVANLNNILGNMGLPYGTMRQPKMDHNMNLPEMWEISGYNRVACSGQFTTAWPIPVGTQFEVKAGDSGQTLFYR